MLQSVPLGYASFSWIIIIISINYFQKWVKLKDGWVWFGVSYKCNNDNKHWTWLWDMVNW